MNDLSEELLRLTSREVEGTLTSEERSRLVELLQQDEQLVNLYTDYLCLHGQLTWDAGQHVGVHAEPVVATGDSRPRGESVRRVIAVAVTILAVVGGYFLLAPPGDEPDLVESDETDATIRDSGASSEHRDTQPATPFDLQPLNVAKHSRDVSAEQRDDHRVEPKMVARLPDQFSDDLLISKVDELIEKAWTENEVDVASMAEDAEWVRRCFLTFTGRIPTLDESTAFLEERSPRKRQALIDSLLQESEWAETMATVWTNLLIGRTERRGVNREMLFDYLAEQFGGNNAWIDTVGDLITASGRNDQNGATNFLLAHLNDQATPATAVTARLFLGEQISCVQCHDHPFSKSIKQEDYWALNAFFKDTIRVKVETEKPSKSRYLTCRLVDRAQAERITHFEARNGQQKAVLPKYDDYVIPESSTENRRRRLAGLLASDSNTRIARAMVNRVWAQFFGFGFTNPVDDMGPHATVSHPQVLDLMTEAFVKSDYDVQRLMRWIALTKAWQLSSEATTPDDVPEHGEVPLFSRVYTRRMTPEQVYESVRVAIRSASRQPTAHNAESLKHRRDWVQQFARAYETDENDEAVNFEGTIAQAMVMMNGVEVDKAIRLATGALLQRSSNRTPTSQLLDRIAMSILTRPPSSTEKRAFRAHQQKLAQIRNDATSVAFEDMMWAYLNSSEFVLVH